MRHTSTVRQWFWHLGDVARGRPAPRAPAGRRRAAAAAVLVGVACGYLPTHAGTEPISCDGIGPIASRCSDGEASSAGAAEVFEEEEEVPSVMLLQTTLRQQRRPAFESHGSVEAKVPEVAAAPAAAAPPAASQTSARRAGPSAARRPDVLGRAFVFLFEWSWDDVAKECEAWLGPKGFNAVLVSPPNEHINGSGWNTRYQPVSYNLTSRSGSESQFVSMVQRCNAVGVGVYADAVFNHCAAQSGVGVGGSSFGYRTYPMYRPEDFHHAPGDDATNCGVSNYDNQSNVQYCDLLGLPDLCTSCEHVQRTIAAYINRMGELGISGYRIDAAKHMNATELGSLLKHVDPSLYLFMEVSASPGEIVQAPMYYPNGPVTEFGFAATVAPKFTGKGLLRDDLAKVGEAWGLIPSAGAVVFLDNQDTQRSGAAPLTYKSGASYDLTSIFMLAYPYGYPKVMSSYRFDSDEEGPPTTSVHGPDGAVNCGETKPWVCEHRRLPLANMVAWRRAAGGAPIRGFTSGGDSLAFCRGEAACVALNLMDTVWEPGLRLTLPEGTYCDIIQSDRDGCPPILVGADGIVHLQVPPMGAVALHVNALAQESGDNYEDSMPLQ